MLHPFHGFLLGKHLPVLQRESENDVLPYLHEFCVEHERRATPMMKNSREENIYLSYTGVIKSALLKNRYSFLIPDMLPDILLFRQPICPDVIVEYSGDGENPVVVYELPFIVKLAVICHEGLNFLRFGAGGIAEIDAKQIADPSCAVHPCRQRSPMADLANDAAKGFFNAIVERFFEGLGEKYTGVS